MRTGKNRETISIIITSLLVLLWSYTALSKWADPSGFMASLNKQPTGKRYSEMLFWMVPSAELITAALLLFPRTRQMGLYLSAVLMLTFTLYVSAAVLGLYQKLPCSCGGVIGELTWTHHLIFNITFLLLAAWAACTYRKETKP